MKPTLNITSEIGTLKTVVLKRPGPEVENMIPQNTQRFLFDDIPYLHMIQKEHDQFAGILRKQGVEVLDLKELLTEVFRTKDIKDLFVLDFLNESKAPFDENQIGQALENYLQQLSAEDFVEKVFQGVRKEELFQEQKIHLHDYMEDSFPFYVSPQPNVYFMRDPACVIGNGVTLNNMKSEIRKRESLFFQYILKYHERFKESEIPIWLNRDYPFSLEGGDLLVLSKETLAIGISERTSAKAIEQLAANIFKQNTTINNIIAAVVPKSRTFMHLDTIFTMVNKDTFCIYPVILTEDIYLLERGTVPQCVNVSKQQSLEVALKKVLGLDEVNFIICGGDDKVASSREQWNDATNTLAISPGVVITYDRNYITNDLLRKNGIIVHEIPSSELSRGGGGPRCMSMPLIREDISFR
ncbi:arginine deiminase [Metabacillus malikii]|uniref:Arginine deiminase n=1 Tax=Metabacillus malikii TaxID=1504265 RepID=A0ABT9ZJF3_9BACI|nr:arginine deiminase [Metabacillus malikii]MDQ0232388.1 arginine deiminase [Metabacillus malikii]